MKKYLFLVLCILLLAGPIYAGNVVTFFPTAGEEGTTGEPDIITLGANDKIVLGANDKITLN